jgi:hypothetical protein
MPNHAFYSDNSGMAQGEALSLLTRAARHDVVEGQLKQAAEDAAERIAANMILPLELGGTRLTMERSVYFCELCRTDRHVVLNGWMYALFGLQDYQDWQPNVDIAQVLADSLDTLRREAIRYVLPSGWSLYDNHGRVASPFYHRLHIALLDAQARLSPARPFDDVLADLGRADTRWNRIRFTALKVKDKVFDTSRHTTSGRFAARACSTQEAA